MRVCIRINKGRSFSIPVPMWIVKMGFSDFVKRCIIRYVPEKDRKYLEAIDFVQLQMSMDLLSREYKGLRLVEVNDNNGTEIYIIV